MDVYWSFETVFQVSVGEAKLYCLVYCLLYVFMNNIMLYCVVRCRVILTSFEFFFFVLLRDDRQQE